MISLLRDSQDHPFWEKRTLGQAHDLSRQHGPTKPWVLLPFLSSAQAWGHGLVAAFVGCSHRPGAAEARRHGVGQQEGGQAPCTLFWGRVPLLKIDYRKKGTLILTSLLEDPEQLHTFPYDGRVPHAQACASARLRVGWTEGDCGSFTNAFFHGT